MTRADPEDVLLAGLALGRAPASPKDAAAWLVASIAERVDLPPPGVVLDLGAILFGRLSSEPIPSDDASLVSAVRRYEDTFLRRLAADPGVVAAGDAASRFGQELRAGAIAVLVSSSLANVGFDGGIAIEPGTVRRVLDRAPTDARRSGEAILRSSPAIRDLLGASYLAIARGAQRTRDLLGAADRFSIEHLDVLGALTQRLAIGDVLRAEEAIARRMPPTRRRRRGTSGDVASLMLDESVYPAGGFASLSTSGSLENVVTSELVYMDPPGEGRGLDLFDVRYTEGELLYYTRDEAILVRHRRHVLVALGASLVRARVKDPGVAWQRIVLVMAVVVIFVKRVAEALGNEALTIELAFAPRVLDPERLLLELLLRDFRERGVVEVSERPDVRERFEERARRARVDVLRLGSDAEVDRAIDVDVGSADVEGWVLRAKAMVDAVL